MQCLAMGLALATLAIGPTTLLTGCKSVNTTAYKATGVTAATVDAAMQAWGDYVHQKRVAGTPVSVGDETKVAMVYGHYQIALKAMTDAGVSYTTAAANKDPNVSVFQQNLLTASATLSGVMGDLVALVASFGINVPVK